MYKINKHECIECIYEYLHIPYTYECVRICESLLVIAYMYIYIYIFQIYTYAHYFFFLDCCLPWVLWVYLYTLVWEYTSYCRCAHITYARYFCFPLSFLFCLEYFDCICLSFVALLRKDGVWVCTDTKVEIKVIKIVCMCVICIYRFSRLEKSDQGGRCNRR